MVGYVIAYFTMGFLLACVHAICDVEDAETFAPLLTFALWPPVVMGWFFMGIGRLFGRGR